jgi:hypothetical protein
LFDFRLLQQYPQGNLYCFYKTQEQCHWTAAGIGGLRPESAFAFPDQTARFLTER